MLAWSFRGGIYKKQPLDILEFSFILNLGLLSVATLYTYNVGGDQAAVSYTSVGIALATFTGILFYHAWKHTACLRKCLSPLASSYRELLAKEQCYHREPPELGGNAPLLPPFIYQYHGDRYRKPLDLITDEDRREE